MDVTLEQVVDIHGSHTLWVIAVMWVHVPPGVQTPRLDRKKRTKGVPGTA
jgi:hypothetical protein